jgi:hypothetical protein
VGDWKNGERIAQEGRGMQYSDDPKGPVGANCYACHRLSPQELSFGTIGPSLYQFGKVRGYTDEVRKYAYGKIYKRRGLQRLHEHAALRPTAGSCRPADSRCRRAADGSGIPRQQVSHERGGRRGRGARMNRREFLASARGGAVAGFPLASRSALEQGRAAATMYDVAPFGNVSLLHFTDCHAQLLPVHFREPSVNLGFVLRSDDRRISSAKRCSATSASNRKRSRPTRSRISISRPAAKTYGRSAASRTSQRSSSS